AGHDELGVAATKQVTKELFEALVDLLEGLTELLLDPLARFFHPPPNRLLRAGQVAQLLREIGVAVLEGAALGEDPVIDVSHAAQLGQGPCHPALQGLVVESKKLRGNITSTCA